MRERSKRSRSQVNLLGRTEVDIEANGWGYAKSWHLEVQVPTGLLIDELRYETWDPESLDLTSDGTDSGGPHTSRPREFCFTTASHASRALRQLDLRYSTP
jgi:hypothetical protein